MTRKTDVIRPVDEESAELTGTLLGATKYGSLGVLEPETGFPVVSRVAACSHIDTGLFFAASDLSVHSKCLVADPRCSLMLGEPGKGDGLAYPRITLLGTTRRIANDDPERDVLRKHFVATHPKSKLYIDFLDFGFYRLDAERALLNGGFGKAYHLEEKDLKPFLG
jgi:hypothetical protein